MIIIYKLDIEYELNPSLYNLVLHNIIALTTIYTACIDRNIIKSHNIRDIRVRRVRRGHREMDIWRNIRLIMPIFIIKSHLIDLRIRWKLISCLPTNTKPCIRIFNMSKCQRLSLYFSKKYKIMKIIEKKSEKFNSKTKPNIYNWHK